MKILLCGGTGFIGEYLTKEFSANLGLEIAVPCRCIPLNSGADNVRYVQSDLFELNSTMEELVAWADIIVILTQPDKRVIENLIHSLQKGGNVKRVVYVSSLLVYNDSTEKQDENAPLYPVSQYEKGKCEEEIMLTEFLQTQNIKLCIARLSNVYGDIKNKGLVNYAFRSVLDGKAITINGTGDSVRDYIFVEDVVSWIAYLILWNQENAREVFNLCTGKGYRIIEVIEAIEKVTQKTINKIYGPSVKEKNVIIGENKKIIELSGIVPSFTFSKGLEKTYQNYLLADTKR